jgi:hypothetical protein
LFEVIAKDLVNQRIVVQLLLLLRHCTEVHDLEYSYYTTSYNFRILIRFFSLSSIKGMRVYIYYSIRAAGFPLSRRKMADALLSGPTTPVALWLSLVAAVVATVLFSVWGFYQAKAASKKASDCEDSDSTNNDVFAVLKDLTTQHMLQRSLLVCFINIIIPAALMAHHFIWIRPGTVDTAVSYIQWIGWAINFAVLARSVAEYLALNYVHADFVFQSAGLSVLALLAASFFANFQYLWYVVHLVGFVYTIHVLWVYRRRPGKHGVAVLVFISFFWLVGFSLPFGLGHAFSQWITFEGEWWWYAAAVLFGQELLCLYMCSTLYDLEHKHYRHVIKHFRSREATIGIPGDQSLALLLMVNQGVIGSEKGV